MTWQAWTLLCFAVAEMAISFVYRRLVNKCIRTMAEQNKAFAESTDRWSKITSDLIADNLIAKTQRSTRGLS